MFALGLKHAYLLQRIGSQSLNAQKIAQENSLKPPQNLYQIIRSPREPTKNIINSHKSPAFLKHLSLFTAKNPQPRGSFSSTKSPQGTPPNLPGFKTPSPQRYFNCRLSLQRKTPLKPSFQELSLQRTSKLPFETPASKKHPPGTRPHQSRPTKRPGRTQDLPTAVLHSAAVGFTAGPLRPIASVKHGISQRFKGGYEGKPKGVLGVLFFLGDVTLYINTLDFSCSFGTVWLCSWFPSILCFFPGAFHKSKWLVC